MLDWGDIYFFSWGIWNDYLIALLQLKGCTNKKTNEEIERLLEANRLVHKRDQLSSALSGGMKRKLCVAIALIGDSEVSK